jgi:hypothetical protein
MLRQLRAELPLSATAAIWRLVRLEGFEPPTNGFGSHYSIRLSYRRLELHAVAACAGDSTPLSLKAPLDANCRRGRIGSGASRHAD